MYVRLFSYARYLNQKGLDETYTDAFGKVQTVPRREDVQLNKFFLPFSGWFLTPKFRYYLYVWSANTVARRSRAGRGRREHQLRVQPLRHIRRRHHQPARACAAPKASSPTGSAWTTRLIADEFFRGSYTTGFWVKGEIATKFKYHGDDRQQPEHARRQRGATRQHVRHARRSCCSGCRRPASSACTAPSATSTTTRSWPRASPSTTRTAPRTSRVSPGRTASRTPRSG